MKRIISFAAVTAAFFTAVPARADLVNKANQLCKAVYELNQTAQQSVAPGTTIGNILAKKTYNGYSYSSLWSLAKEVGTSSDCKKMY